MVTNLMLFLKHMTSQGQSDDDTDMLSTDVSTGHSCLRLLDMSARVVGQHCSCEQLEAQQPPLDEALLRMVSDQGFVVLQQSNLQYFRRFFLVQETLILEYIDQGCAICHF